MQSKQDIKQRLLQVADGMYRYYKQSGNQEFLQYLTAWYEERIEAGLPPKNVNTMAPMLTLAHLYEETCKESPVDAYYLLCEEWAAWIMKDMPRTEGGGFQHICIDRPNTEQLWDDTLFMTVLFLAKWGTVTKRKEYVQESIYQFLIHAEYLKDKETGLWFHGWTFLGRHNYAKALWGRGNCWITAGIVDYLEMIEPEESVRQYLIHILREQASALKRFQDESGMWHTLIDDSSSYLEASATAGFAYGILKGIRLGFLDTSYSDCGRQALEAVIDRIDENGIVGDVSYGTAMGSDLDFYRSIPISPMPYGQALTLMLLGEALYH